MASVFEQLQEKYRGFTVDYSGEEKKTTITYQGTKEMCIEAMNNTYKVNTKDSTYGNIESVRISNGGNGPIWDLEVVYSISYDHSGTASGTGSAYGAKSSELSMSILSLPIESKAGYRKKWNNNFYATKKGIVVPAWWDTATNSNDYVSNTSNEYDGRLMTPSTTKVFYAWAASKSECPVLNGVGAWFKVRSMTKPRS